VALNGDTLTFTKTGGNLGSADFTLSLSGTTLTGTINVDIYNTLTLASKAKLAAASYISGNTDSVFAPRVCTLLQTL
jgi:hypothetical protein